MSAVKCREINVNQWLALSAAGPGLEAGQYIGLGDLPIHTSVDIINHAGNMWVGSGSALIASLAVSAYARHKEGLESEITTLPEQDFERNRNIAIAAAVGIAAVANCITETKWGVRNLPIAEMLGGTVVDGWDNFYSTAYAAICSLFIWNRSYRRA